jgi:hypothetical protein
VWALISLQTDVALNVFVNVTPCCCGKHVCSVHCLMQHKRIWPYSDADCSACYPLAQVCATYDISTYITLAAAAHNAPCLLQVVGAALTPQQLFVKPHQLGLLLNQPYCALLAQNAVGIAAVQHKALKGLQPLQRLALEQASATAGAIPGAGETSSYSALGTAVILQQQQHQQQQQQNQQQPVLGAIGGPPGLCPPLLQSSATAAGAGTVQQAMQLQQLAVHGLVPTGIAAAAAAAHEATLQQQLGLRVALLGHSTTGSAAAAAGAQQSIWRQQPGLHAPALGGSAAEAALRQLICGQQAGVRATMPGSRAASSSSSAAAATALSALRQRQQQQLPRLAPDQARPLPATMWSHQQLGQVCVLRQAQTMLHSGPLAALSARTAEEPQQQPQQWQQQQGLLGQLRDAVVASSSSMLVPPSAAAAADFAAAADAAAFDDGAAAAAAAVDTAAAAAATAAAIGNGAAATDFVDVGLEGLRALTVITLLHVHQRKK